MNKMVRVIRTLKRKVLDENGSARAPIYEDESDHTNLKPGADCNGAVVKTKHGIALMFWADDQPKIEDLGVDIDEVLAEEGDE